MSSKSSSFPNQIQIELHVPDFDVVKDFYQKLGFHIVWEENDSGGSGNYLVMENEGTFINFWPGNETVWEQSYFKNFPKDTKRGYGVEIVYTVKNVSAYYENVKDSVKIVEPLRKRPWGLLDFRMEDPFGYYLRVTEPMDIRKFGPSSD